MGGINGCPGNGVTGRRRSIITETGRLTNSTVSGFKDIRGAARVRCRCNRRGAQVAQQEGQKKAKGQTSIHQCTFLRQIRALRVHAMLDGYQSAAGSIFQRTASAKPDLPSADCDPVPSLVESSDSGGVCFLSCWWSLFSFLDSFYTNLVTLLHIATVDILSSPLIWSS